MLSQDLNQIQKIGKGFAQKVILAIGVEDTGLGEIMMFGSHLPKISLITVKHLALHGLMPLLLPRKR